MSVELPVAPVDALIRRHAGSLRVSAEAAEELARHIQRRGAAVASEAAERATREGRKTLKPADFDGLAAGATESVGEVVDPGLDTEPKPEAEPELPIAPVDRIARLDIDPGFRVATDARVVLAGALEAHAANVAAAAAILARHAGRRTIKAEDVEAYRALEAHFPGRG
jgi:histone H3/H4